ncbi:MAG: TIGR02391 family protein [Candidatus Saccharibacteria bacterium]
MSKAKIIKFRDDLTEYRKLLYGSRDVLAKVDFSAPEIKKLRTSLIGQLANIEEEITKLSRHPKVADPVWRQYQDAYTLAISTDILQRVGPAIDAALDDLEYVISKYKAIKNKNTNMPIGVYYDISKLHPTIIKHCSKKFEDGYLSDSILTAYKVVLNEIKEITGISDKDGKPLVEQALSLNSPIIKLNGLRTQTDKDEQQGYMFLLSGAALGIRNPKAHDLVEQDDPQRALQLLSFASLLMHRLDERSEPK